MSAIRKIQIIINTLNQITVKGKENMDYLLGSIQTLEQIKREMEAAPNGEASNQN